MAQRWLFKTEPTAYSFDQLERDKRTTWDGVKNPLARKHLREIARGDLVLIYHTGNEKAVIGIGKTVSDPYPDPKTKDAGAVVVDLAPVKRLPRPVALGELKARPTLKSFPLVRLPRLSVMPVGAAEWAEIEQLANQ